MSRKSSIIFHDEATPDKLNSELSLLTSGAHLCIIESDTRRDFHRIVASAEDIGFEVRDIMLWARQAGELQIALLRKPCESTIVDNVITHGCGGLNIDACRVTFKPGEREAIEKQASPNDRFKPGVAGVLGWCAGRTRDTVTHAQGRFPSNLLHDGSDEVVALFPESGSGKSKTYTRGERHDDHVYGGFPNQIGTEFTTYGDTGSTARFFNRVSDMDALVKFLERLVTQPE